MAMIAYLVLGALAFATLSDFRIRALTLLILAMFAFKSWVRRKDLMHPDVESESEPDALAEGRRPTADGRFEPM
jgi:hypothetical protein